MKEDEGIRENIGNAVTSIHSKLTALLKFKPSGQLFQGEVNLVRQNHASNTNFCELFMVSV